MQENAKKYMELANRIYDLDAEVYDCVGSSLGRTFTGDRENTIRTLCALMLTKPDGHLLRSELALISNMARTVKDKKKRALDTFGTNLTNKAKNNQLDLVVGRDKEIQRIIQILNRRSKNNPCLIGEPGVGKTAIAQGLAIKIANGRIPAKLLNKEVYLLDMTSIMMKL